MPRRIVDGGDSLRMRGTAEEGLLGGVGVGSGVGEEDSGSHEVASAW